MPLKEVELIVDYGVRGLCRKPYPLHPNGCPNFGKRPSCPPDAPRILDLIDKNEPVSAIWTVFDFGAHIEKMRAAHPNWSQRQLECCLYWQGGARKRLNEEIGFFGMAFCDDQHVLLKCPEACGVNVTATMASIGEILEWPPRTKAYQVAIVGMKREATP